MNLQPTLSTERLILRPYSLDDVPDVVRLIGDARVSDTILTVPYPYSDHDGVSWISTREVEFRSGKSANFAITLAKSGEYIGGIGLNFNPAQNYAELGYWVGLPHWNKGYVTEAARAVVDWGFRERNLNRILARHVLHNLASGRVMLKIGMQYEGTLREHAHKGGVYFDMVMYGVLRREWENTAVR